MLWYKAWLETRWRLVFLIGLILLVWLTPLWLPSLGLRLPARSSGVKGMVRSSPRLGHALHLYSDFLGRLWGK